MEHKDYDDLLRLIEQLQRENAELRQALDEANGKLLRVEHRDDLLQQYQNEAAAAKQRLTLNTQTLKEVQGVFRLLVGLAAELLKQVKGAALDKQGKQKLSELANRLRQVVGGQETIDKFDSLIQENNLQGLVQEMLQTKAKSVHQKELLSMEQEFQDNLEKIRLQLQD